VKLEGNIVDIRNRKIFGGEILFKEERIIAITPNSKNYNTYILPGFVDAHIHIESSMLVPSEFAKMALPHGTVATISDPHEIANVLGLAGVNYMIDNGNKVPLKFNFGAPSCVPATNFETAGAIVSVKDIEHLMARDDIKYLAEMMNYPGVLNNDEAVHQKINIAKKYGKSIDGHAPGLRGKEAQQYIDAGIYTDHECFTYDEAEEKLSLGMKILIREGSAAKNFDALIDLLPEHFNQMMFCSDDKHPDDLMLGHINQLVARAVDLGIDKFKVLQAACINPVEHYGLEVGTLQVGDYADCIVVKDLKQFEIIETYINGQLVAQNGKHLIESTPIEIINNFNTRLKKPAQFQLEATTSKLRIIEALDGELITKELVETSLIKDGNVQTNVGKDILKMAVVNRYKDVEPAIAFIKGFGLQSGAIASCVGHDSHNIIVVGVDDESICKAVNLIIHNKGGIAVVSEADEAVLPLPIAGIISDQDGVTVGKTYSRLDQKAKALGSTLSAPFMTLSFMALLVIPQLKLSDLGLFDGATFQFVDLQC